MNNLLNLFTFLARSSYWISSEIVLVFLINLIIVVGYCNAVLISCCYLRVLKTRYKNVKTEDMTNSQWLLNPVRNCPLTPLSLLKYVIFLLKPSSKQYNYLTGSTLSSMFNFRTNGERTSPIYQRTDFDPKNIRDLIKK